MVKDRENLEQLLDIDLVRFKLANALKHSTETKIRLEKVETVDTNIKATFVTRKTKEAFDIEVPFSNIRDTIWELLNKLKSLGYMKEIKVVNVASQSGNLLKSFPIAKCPESFIIEKVPSLQLLIKTENAKAFCTVSKESYRKFKCFLIDRLTESNEIDFSILQSLFKRRELVALLLRISV